MATMHSSSCLIFSLLLSFLISGAFSTTFMVTNNCGYTIWPGVLSNAGSAILASTGFLLAPGESRSLDAAVPWSGRFWARTVCSADPASGRFSCDTGDCGTAAVECSGAGAATPVTLAEFTLGGGADFNTDFYDVSLVDGYNVPVLVVPQTGGCSPTGCMVDLNVVCPPELRVVAPDAGGAVVACRSACEKFGTDQYCCSGDFGSPGACGPTAYSLFFKNACPRAYSYAYDDATSTFTCATAAATSYTITFCPSSSSLKSKDSGNPQAAAGLPPINTTVVNFSGLEVSSAGGVGVRPMFLFPRSTSSQALLLLRLAALAMPWHLLH